MQNLPHFFRGEEGGKVRGRYLFSRLNIHADKEVKTENNPSPPLLRRERVIMTYESTLNLCACAWRRDAAPSQPISRSLSRRFVEAPRRIDDQQTAAPETETGSIR